MAANADDEPLPAATAVTARGEVAVPRDQHVDATPVRHLDQGALARRWRLSERTLERWRYEGIGPPYLKIGGRVVYRVADVAGYEAANLRGGR
jgi:hypothetical protein